MPTHINHRKQNFNEFLACVPCGLSIKRGKEHKRQSDEMHLLGLKASVASPVFLCKDIHCHTSCTAYSLHHL